MALSNNMNGLLEGNKDDESNEEESHELSGSADGSDAKKKQAAKTKAKAAKEKAKQAIFASQQVLAMDAGKQDEQD